MKDDESIELSLSGAARETLERAARCLGLSQMDAHDVASASMLSIDGYRIIVMEAPAEEELPMCKLMLVSRLDMLDADDIGTLRLVLQTNVHATMCLGASAAADSDGRLLLTMPLHTDFYDPPSFASTLLRFGAMVRQFAELKPPRWH
ncbi:hypothetical protein BH10PSE18_BH10PSE18_23020 [soil metagenome]